MAALDFPNSPTTNQQYAAPNGITYQWDGAAWIVTGGPPATPTGPAGGDLTGSTYPNPVVAALKITNAKLAVGATVRGAVSVALPATFLSATTGAWVTVVTTPSLTTRGGPVLLTLLVGGVVVTNSTAPMALYFGIYRDGTQVVAWRYNVQSATSGTTYAYMPSPSFTWIDAAPSAASHTYAFQINQGAANMLALPGDSAGFLVATELG